MNQISIWTRFDENAFSFKLCWTSTFLHGWVPCDEYYLELKFEPILSSNEVWKVENWLKMHLTCSNSFFPSFLTSQVSNSYLGSRCNVDQAHVVIFSILHIFDENVFSSIFRFFGLKCQLQLSYMHNVTRLQYERI